MAMTENEIRNIRIEDYNYPLPDERIAKHPLAQREMCKLLTYRNGTIGEGLFRDLPSLLPADSMLVYNNTRVINARLRFRNRTVPLQLLRLCRRWRLRVVRRYTQLA